MGEGGALASRDPWLARQAYNFQNFGFAESRGSTQVGMNGKLQEINAAIGLRQLVGLDRRLASRREVFEHYRIKLTGAGLRFQPNAEASALCFGSACSTSADRRAAVLASLREHAIQARESCRCRSTTTWHPTTSDGSLPPLRKGGLALFSAQGQEFQARGNAKWESFDSALS